MNKLARLFLIIIFISAISVSCGEKKRTLHLYNWGDYIDPEVVAQFEKEFHCIVKIDFFDSNEAMYAKLNAGAEGYDVAVPSSFMATNLRQQGLLRKLDHSRIPNLKNLDQSFMVKHPDPNSDYMVPYMVSFIGIGYDSRKVKNFKPSWAMFDRRDLKGRMTLLDEMRPDIGAALKFLGYSINSTDEKELARARDVVIHWKKNIARFGVDDAKMGLASGEFDLIHNYSGDILQIQKENEYLLFAIPVEGTSINDDDLVIPSTARDVDLAYDFINFLLRPDICAKNMTFICYLAPNPAAVSLMPESFRTNKSIFPGDDIMSRCEVMRDLGPDNVKYTKIWDEIKAAK